MEIEVVLPIPFPSSPGFSFDSATSTPYITAPSSPQRFGNSNRFYSSPAAAASAADTSRISFSINPSLWEEGEGSRGFSCSSPKSASDFTDLDDFEFEFDGSKSDRLEFDPALADELFDRGRIKPMKMMTPLLQQGRKSVHPQAPPTATKRVCDILTEEDEENHDDERPMNPTASSTSVPSSSSSRTFSALLSSITNTKGYRKWSFRDFLLFRSASEGRGTGKDPLMKFTALGGKIEREDSFGGSMRGTASFRAASATKQRRQSESRRRGRGAHEVYYWENRAAAEEMKRRTLLPYKQGLLGGCLGFNPNPGSHDLARSFGSMPPRD
ncbi:hypothetical protein SAY86_019373 [Trapa natans]|uniref:Uncharacterized protein n=1 Tax=Trapa natans TaxID=22666 RepID=A0AAN7LNW4_TRANT|nr:hypothetical protein SAY86_019373 [Trapa natans]